MVPEDCGAAFTCAAAFTAAAVIQELRVSGGCQGNLTGIAALVRGMSAQEAIRRLRNIDCGGRGTSCPDQLARGLEQALARS
ncbi:MAG: TIGR03905 family TSCPD domain-containing protein [Oscillibacter sp.]|nr:TIGR03905 family TSCPD domain-containing protein [Oscillibacter sp.]